MDLAHFALVGAATVVALLAAYFTVRQGYERLALVASLACVAALAVGTYLTIEHELEEQQYLWAAFAAIFGVVFALIAVSLVVSSLHRAVKTSWRVKSEPDRPDSKNILLQLSNEGGGYARFTIILEVGENSFVTTESQPLKSGHRFSFKEIALHAGQPTEFPLFSISSAWGGKLHNTRMYTARLDFALLADSRKVASAGWSMRPGVRFPMNLISFQLSILRDPPALRKYERVVRCWIDSSGKLLLRTNSEEPLVLDQYRLREL